MRLDQECNLKRKNLSESRSSLFIKLCTSKILIIPLQNHLNVNVIIVVHFNEIPAKVIVIDLSEPLTNNNNCPITKERIELKEKEIKLLIGTCKDGLKSLFNYIPSRNTFSENNILIEMESCAYKNYQNYFMS